MDSLISRAAAIEVIDAVFPVDPMKSEYAQGIACGAALAKTYIEQLPSAQPATNCSEFPNTSDFVSRKAVRDMVATWSYDMAEWEDMELALHDVDELPPVSAERQRGKENE
jgi:hypothetical protein